LRCKDGVAFAVEKIVTSRLYESGSNKRIYNVDKHIGMVSENRKYENFNRKNEFLGSCRSSC